MFGGRVRDSKKISSMRLVPKRAKHCLQVSCSGGFIRKANLFCDYRNALFLEDVLMFHSCSSLYILRKVLQATFCKMRIKKSAAMRLKFEGFENCSKQNFATKAKIGGPAALAT